MTLPDMYVLFAQAGCRGSRIFGGLCILRVTRSEGQAEG